MTGPLSPLGERFAFNAKLLGLLVNDLQGDEWLHRVGDANHAQWLTGHLANTRRWVLRELGQPVPEDDWEQHFGAGGMVTAQSDAIDPALLWEAFGASTPLLTATLSGLSEAQGARSLPKPFPDGSDTVGGMLHFLHFHEAYHVGQVGLIRRSLGKPGLV